MRVRASSHATRGRVREEGRAARAPRCSPVGSVSANCSASVAPPSLAAASASPRRLAPRAHACLKRRRVALGTVPLQRAALLLGKVKTRLTRPRTHYLVSVPVRAPARTCAAPLDGNVVSTYCRISSAARLGRPRPSSGQTPNSTLAPRAAPSGAPNAMGKFKAGNEECQCVHHQGPPEISELRCSGKLQPHKRAHTSGRAARFPFYQTQSHFATRVS